MGSPRVLGRLSACGTTTPTSADGSAWTTVCMPRTDQAGSALVGGASWAGIRTGAGPGGLAAVLLGAAVA
jgi:hypothetical protein